MASQQCYINNVECIEQFPTNTVKRYSRREKKNVVVDQLYLVRKYSYFMGGVDRCDQNISLNKISICAKKSISFYLHIILP